MNEVSHPKSLVAAAGAVEALFVPALFGERARRGADASVPR
jgi:hypothetical protein